MKKNYHYPDKASIEGIDSVLDLSAKVLDTDKVVIKDKMIVPPLIGASLGGGLMAAGGGGLVAAGGGGGTAAITGGSALYAMAAGGTAAGVSAGMVVAVVAAPVVVIAGVCYFVFRSKKKKKLFNMRLARYTEAVKMQNKTIAKLIEIDKVREQNEKILRRKLDSYAQEVSELRSKINELRAINESLLVIINNLQKDLELDKAA